MSLIPTGAAPVDYRRKIAYELMQQGMDGAPIRHWTQGLAKLGQGALGGYEMYQADQKDKEAEAEGAKAYLSLLQGGGPTAPQAAPAPAMSPPAAPSQNTPMAAPVSPVVSALAPPPVTGPRPGGPVMPTSKVWGDQEAEAAGLYEPSPVKVASLGPTPMPGAPPAAPPQPPAGPQVAQAMSAPPPVADPASDPKAKIVALLQSENPAARKMGKALADNYITAQFKPETTDEIKEYNLYKKQGGPLSFFDYKSGLKKAGAVNVTTNIEKPELAFDTEAGKLQANRFNDLAADGQTAKQMVSDIKTLTDLGKNIGTGKTAEFTAAIGPYAESLGIKIDKLSDIQAYEAIVNRMAPNLRVKGSGAQSDLELKNFLKSLPTLGNTPEGNEIASTVMTGLQENKIRAAEIGSKALNKEITRSEAEKQLRDLPDPMTPYRDYMKANRGASTATKPPAAPTVINGYTIKAR